MCIRDRKTLAKEADVGKTDWMTNIVTGQDKTLREFESGVNGAIPKEAVTRATQKDLASKIVENEQSLAQLLAKKPADGFSAVSYTHLRAHETPEHLVCRLLLEKNKNPALSTPSFSSTLHRISC